MGAAAGRAEKGGGGGGGGGGAGVASCERERGENAAVVVSRTSKGAGVEAAGMTAGRW